VCNRDEERERLKVGECVKSGYNKDWKVGSRCNNKDDWEITAEMINEFLRKIEDRWEWLRGKGDKWKGLRQKVKDKNE